MVRRPIGEAPGNEVARLDPLSATDFQIRNRLAGAREFLSFDERLKALAASMQMRVFPPLGAEGKALLADLRR